MATPDQPAVCVRGLVYLNLSLLWLRPRQASFHLCTELLYVGTVIAALLVPPRLLEEGEAQKLL